MELRHIEQAEAYLTGTMSADARALFEQEISNSAELKQLVENQQLMMQTIRRQALLAEIQKISSKGGSGMSSIAQWLSVIVITAGLTTAGIYWKYSRDKHNPPVVKASANKPGETPSPSQQNAGAGSMENDTSSVVTQTLSEENTNGPSPQEPITHSPAPMHRSGGRNNRQSRQESTNALSQSGQADASTEALIKEIDNITLSKQSGENPEADKSAEIKSTVYNENGGLQTWVAPQKQSFEVNPVEGQTIECSDGTLVIVPENAFIDQNGNVITEPVKLEIIEALSLADMLAYNLTTMDGEKYLQSGGMVYIQPKLNGENVFINPEKPLFIEIPTAKEVPGMMAWKGEADGSGNLSWTNPKALEKFLVPVDFSQLDFLPPGFAEEVEASLPFKNYTSMSKSLADSLYYTLSFTPVPPKDSKEVTPKGGKLTLPLMGAESNPVAGSSSLKGTVTGASDGKPVAGATVEVTIEGAGIYKSTTDSEGRYVINGIPPNKESGYRTRIIVNCPNCIPHQVTGTIFSADKTSFLDVSISQKKTEMAGETGKCMIKPLSIKTIKTMNFANTFLATKEFEERLAVLHQLPDGQALLDLYLNNLSKNLFEIDSMVAEKLTGEERNIFKTFAALKHTNVIGAGNIHQQELVSFYNQKRTQLEVENTRRVEAYQQKTVNELKAMNQELAATATGNQPLTTGSHPNLASCSSYKVSWYETGWMNIDAYVSLLDGEARNVEIVANTNEESARVYQAISLLNTVVPLVVGNGKALAVFPAKDSEAGKKMQSVYCIGISKANNKISYAEQRYNPYETESVSLVWEIVSEEGLTKKLHALPGSNLGLVASLKADQEEIARQLRLAAKRESIQAEIQKVNDQKEAESLMMQRLLKIATSCGVKESDQQEPFL